MSIDTYFCICCLSTNDLTCLYNSDSDKNYAGLLKDLFFIKVFQQENEDDSYICELCAGTLGDVQTFKKQVWDTLNVLQGNGLIKINKTNGEITISKVLQEFEEDKYEMESKYLEDPTQNLKPPKTEQNTIKQEQIEHNNLVNIEIINGADIIRKAISGVPNVLLERDKRITVAKKEKRRREAKREPRYEVTDDFKCQICSTVLPNVYVYHSHMNGHYPNHVCDACGKGFLTERRLKRHMPSHKKGPFKCLSCDSEFTNYNTLSSHRQRKHSTVDLYKCPYCDERFATFTRRALHLTSAHAQPAGKYVCVVCKKSFLLAGNLSAHMRNKHLKIKRHFCAECGVGFYHKQELSGHMAVHTGMNEFQCNICNKRYPRKKALDVHMRIHTNDRRFCCDICGKRFVQKCTMQAHVKTHNRDS